MAPASTSSTPTGAERPPLSEPGTVDVVVGRVGRPHGVRGEVTVEVRTDEPERRFADGSLLRGVDPRGAPRPLTVRETRWHQGRLLVAFAELEGRDAAESARGVVLHLEVPADASPEEADEYYDHQLVGLAVHDEDGAPLGELTGLVHGAQDLLVVRTPEGRDALVPFVAALVPEVDLAAGRVVVADRPGLVRPHPETGPDDEAPDDEAPDDEPRGEG